MRKEKNQEAKEEGKSLGPVTGGDAAPDSVCAGRDQTAFPGGWHLLSLFLSLLPPTLLTRSLAIENSSCRIENYGEERKRKKRGFSSVAFEFSIGPGVSPWVRAPTPLSLIYERASRIARIGFRSTFTEFIQSMAEISWRIGPRRIRRESSTGFAWGEL